MRRFARLTCLSDFFFLTLFVFGADSAAGAAGGVVASRGAGDG